MKKIFTFLIMLIMLVMFVPTYAKADIVKIFDFISLDVKLKGGITWTPFEPEFKPSAALSLFYFDIQPSFLKYKYKIDLDYTIKKEKGLVDGEYKDVFNIDKGNLGLTTNLTTPFKLVDEIVSRLGGKINFEFLSVLELLDVGFGYNFNSGKLEINGFVVNIKF